MPGNVSLEASRDLQDDQLPAIETTMEISTFSTTIGVLLRAAWDVNGLFPGSLCLFLTDRMLATRCSPSTFRSTVQNIDEPVTSESIAKHSESAPSGAAI